MDDEEVALESLGVIEGSRFFVAFGVRLRSPHEDFLEPGVVEVGLGLGGDGDPDVVLVWLAEEGVQGIGAASAPAPDGDAGKVDVGAAAAHFPEALGLLLGAEGPQAAEDGAAPGRALGRRRTAVVHGDNEIALVGDRTVKEGVPLPAGPT